jgi:hypothetical protein
MTSTQTFLTVYKLSPMLDTPGYASLYRPIISESDSLALTDSLLFTVVKGSNPRIPLPARSLSSTWQPPVVALNPPYNPSAPITDYPLFGLRFPVFSERAKDALEGRLCQCGELLPLQSAPDSPNYWCFNITRFEDCLDVENSQVEWFGTDRLHFKRNQLTERPVLFESIQKHEFITSKVADLYIFRLIHDPLALYVTHDFVNDVSRARLRGFDFTEIWRSNG